MQLRSCLILLLLIYSEALWAQKAINSKDGVQINGLQQFLEINGKDPQKPLLLFFQLFEICNLVARSEDLQSSTRKKVKLYTD